MAPGNALTPRLTAPRPGAAVPPQRTAAHPSTAADLRRFAFELPSRAESVARARGLVADRLVRWSADADIRDAAELVVSELFTNAVLHTLSSRIVCELRDRGDRLRVAVHDEGRPAGTPRPRSAEAGECGRGC
nr:ATP-binding protein [Streptomyces sp. CC228A]